MGARSQRDVASVRRLGSGAPRRRNRKIAAGQVEESPFSATHFQSALGVGAGVDSVFDAQIPRPARSCPDEQGPPESSLAVALRTDQTAHREIAASNQLQISTAVAAADIDRPTARHRQVDVRIETDQAAARLTSRPARRHQGRHCETAPRHDVDLPAQAVGNSAVRRDVGPGADRDIAELGHQRNRAAAAADLKLAGLSVCSNVAENLDTRARSDVHATPAAGIASRRNVDEVHGDRPASTDVDETALAPTGVDIARKADRTTSRNVDVTSAGGGVAARGSDRSGGCTNDVSPRPDRDATAIRIPRLMSSAQPTAQRDIAAHLDEDRATLGLAGHVDAQPRALRAEIARHLKRDHTALAAAAAVDKTARADRKVRRLDRHRAGTHLRLPRQGHRAAAEVEDAVVVEREVRSNRTCAARIRAAEHLAYRAGRRTDRPGGRHPKNSGEQAAAECRGERRTAPMPHDARRIDTLPSRVKLHGGAAMVS